MASPQSGRRYAASKIEKVRTFASLGALLFLLSPLLCSGQGMLTEEVAGRLNVERAVRSFLACRFLLTFAQRYGTRRKFYLFAARY